MVNQLPLCVDYHVYVWTMCGLCVDYHGPGLLAANARRGVDVPK